MSGKTALIFLHGSGGDGVEVKSFLDCLPLTDFGHETFSDVAKSIDMDIITPTADTRRYTAMNYERLNIWFDRTAKFFSKDGLDDKEDLDGVELSLSKIFKIIEEIEPRYDHIFLGGHSMGGVLMLHVLRKNVSPKVRGLFSIGSCLLNMSEVFVGPGLGNASKLPLLMMHGKADDMVPCDWSSKTASALLVMGVDVQFRSYDAYHGLEEEELSDLMHWMQDILYTHLKATAAVENSSGSGSAAQKTISLKSAGNDSSDEETEEGSDNRQEATVASVGRLLQQTSVSSASAATTGKSVDCVPYTIEYDSKNTTQVTVRYSVPQEYIGLMASRPILACGSTFEIVPDPPNGVKTSLISSDPDKTATEIGKRLYFRASSGSANLNPCQMS